jgi:hypothetical protein
LHSAERAAAGGIGSAESDLQKRFTSFHLVPLGGRASYSQFGYSTLPVASLGDDLQRFIETRIRENGGEIT